MPKVISTRMHGVLDYMTAGLMLILSMIIGWENPAGMLLLVMGGATLLYSLMTHYELGMMRMIPMGMHLTLDFISGVILMVAAFMLVEQPNYIQFLLGAIGFFEICASLMTDTEPAIDALAGPEVYTRSRGV